MEEENITQDPKEEQGEQRAPDLGKFKSVDALMRAYGELEAEFTRRSQRLKVLEDAERQRGASAQPVTDSEALYSAVKENGEVSKRIVEDYLQSVRGVPLLSGAGAAMPAPANKPQSIREAGALALGYFRNQRHGG